MKILFPEGNDSRIKEAAKTLKERSALNLEFVHKGSPNPHANYIRALEILRSGKADILIAGAQIAHAEFLPLVFASFSTKRDRDLLFSIALVHWRAKNRRFVIMDSVVVIEPTVSELASMINSARDLAETLLGGERVQVCLISHASTMDRLGKETKQGRVIAELQKLGLDCVTTTPLQLDAALDPEVARVKVGTLGRRPNLLVLPEITSANVLYKSIELFGGDSVRLGAAVLWPVPKGVIGLLPRTCTREQIVDSVEDLVAVANRNRRNRGDRD